MFQIVCLREFSFLLEMNSKLLQSSKITAEEAFDSIERVQIRLQEMRLEKEFEMIYEKVKKLAIIDTEIDDHQLSKHKRTELASLKNCFVHYHFQVETYHSTDKNKIKQMFYKAIDAISWSLEKRFLHNDLDVVKQIEKFIISAANNIRSNKDDIARKLQHFKSLVCFDERAEELADRHVHIKFYNKESNTSLKKVKKYQQFRNFKQKTDKQEMPSRNT